MRWKIIAVNSLIVLLVGVLSYALLRAGLGDLASNPAQLKADAERALGAANTKLELDAVRAERWLPRWPTKRRAARSSRPERSARARKKHPSIRIAFYQPPSVTRFSIRWR
jgi:hypothetical protein